MTERKDEQKKTKLYRLCHRWKEAYFFKKAFILFCKRTKFKGSTYMIV